MNVSEAFEGPSTRHEIRIEECGEPLVAISADGRFVFADPHPYVSLGAPYGNATPFVVRASVNAALEKAAMLLDEFHPGWKLKIYDAYRPIEVQAFMVDHVADSYCRMVAGILLNEAEDEIRERAYAHAHGIWAPAIDDPLAPPPHSTGAAVDLTIVDENGYELDMGSLIDEHENAHPDAFEESDHPEAGTFQKNRDTLKAFMESAGFSRLAHEWWHFSLGDQHSVFEKIKKGFAPKDSAAKYGRAKLGTVEIDVEI